MKTLKYDRNKPLEPQLRQYRKMLKELHAVPQVGQALTVPLQKLTLLDFKDSILQQCMEHIRRGK